MLIALIAAPLGALLAGVIAELAWVRTVGTAAVTANLLAWVLLRSVTNRMVSAARTTTVHPRKGVGDRAPTMLRTSP